MVIPDISGLWPFLITTVLLYLIIVGRYVIIAGMFHLIFYIWFPDTWQKRKINSRPYKSGQFRKEFRWSMVTAAIFAVTGTLTILAWQKQLTSVYAQVDEYPLWWLPVSLVVSLMLHETYYYWLHRWMHHPRVFRIVHRVHHDSNITSPWTAFSFHPLEGLFQAIFLPLLIFILPMHVYIILLQLTIMTVSSVINHLDIEIYPKGFHKHFWGKWFIGATHHSLHHKQFRYNYGLYFTFWDKMKKTESPLYSSLAEEKTGGRSDKA